MAVDFSSSAPMLLLLLLMIFHLCSCYFSREKAVKGKGDSHPPHCFFFAARHPRPRTLSQCDMKKFQQQISYTQFRFSI
jgi:hypothetical protein